MTHRSKALASAALFAALAFFSAACGDSRDSNIGGDNNGGESKGGSMATDFTTRDVDGNTFRLSDMLGKKIILIDFWATWCQPCLAEMPHLQKLYDQYKSKDFVVVAVSMDGPESIADVPSFAKRNQMNFPVLLDEDSRIASIYNPRKSAPLSVLIDKGGHVVTVREGYNAGDEEHVAEDVKKLLDQAAPAAPAPAAH
jgi:peroxiredoxin